MEIKPLKYIDMKNYFFLLFFLILFIYPIDLFGQNWKYKSGKSDFDGNYRTATIVGTGGEHPYKTPMFVVNFFDKGDLNVYFTNAGYAGCDHKVAYFKFDKDDEIYQSQISTNSNRDTWFIETFVCSNKSLKIIDLLEKLKKHNKFSVRLSSDCGKTDYSFSLSGSTAAINFVTKPYYDNIAQSNKDAESEKKRLHIEKLQFDKKMSDSLIVPVEAITLYPEYIYIKPVKDGIWNYKTLSKGESVVIVDYSPESDYYVLKKASSIDIPEDFLLYISKSGVKIK